jgi:hypothetical protein
LEIAGRLCALRVRLKGQRREERKITAAVPTTMNCLYSVKLEPMTPKVFVWSNKQEISLDLDVALPQLVCSSCDPSQ